MWASLLPILGGVALATTSELTQPNTLTLTFNPNPTLNPNLNPNPNPNPNLNPNLNPDPGELTLAWAALFGAVISDVALALRNIYCKVRPYLDT